MQDVTAGLRWKENPKYLTNDWISFEIFFFGKLFTPKNWANSDDYRKNTQKKQIKEMSQTTKINVIFFSLEIFS